MAKATLPQSLDEGGVQGTVIIIDDGDTPMTAEEAKRRVAAIGIDSASLEEFFPKDVSSWLLLTVIVAILGVFIWPFLFK